MKKIILSALCASTLLFASFDNLATFKADFTQSITDDKNKVLHYEGSLVAAKPQNVLWSYVKPVKKDVYINDNNVIVVEPELEQAIFKRIQSKFDFFNIIKNSKQLDKNTYIATYNNKDFLIQTKGNMIESISYVDEFENKVKILFNNQKENEKVDSEIFKPKIPADFDIIKD